MTGCSQDAEVGAVCEPLGIAEVNRGSAARRRLSLAERKSLNNAQDVNGKKIRSDAGELADSLANTQHGGERKLVHYGLEQKRIGLGSWVYTVTLRL
jgi:hypothetical protein